MNDKISRMRALVTGASGYIGSNLVRHLLAENWEVHVVVRPASDLRLIQSELGRITVHHHDGTVGGMIEVFKKATPDTVFHLASLFLAQHKTEDVDALISSNLLFSTQLVEAMAVTGVKHLINTGTSWQYYDGDEYNPVNLYAATKQAFEDILRYYTEVNGLKVITLSLFDTYGPNDPRPKLIYLLWRAAISKEPLMMSPGHQLIDIVYISDVLDAFSLAAYELSTQKDGHKNYGVSSGHPLTLINLVKLFESATDTELPVHFGGRPYREREVFVPRLTYPTLQGWMAKVPFEIGIINCRP